MSRNHRAHQVKADEMMMQISPKAAGDRFADLDGSKLDPPSPKPTFAERRDRHGAGMLFVQERFDLSVSLHSVGEACPARALTRAEDRTNERKNPTNLYGQPFLSLRQALAVELCEPLVQIVVHDDDGELSGSIDNAHPERLQRGPEPAVVPGPAMLRIRHDVARALELTRARRVGESDDRVHYALEEPGDCAPVSLRAVVFLEPADQREVVPVEQPEAIRDLWALSFRLPTEEDVSRSFAGVADLASAVPAFRLRRPLSLDALGDDVDLVLSRV